MRVRPLLRNLRHRAKITPVRIALEWELSIDWEFNPMLYGRATQLADCGPNLDLWMVKSGPRQLLKVVFYTQKCLSQNLAILPVLLSH